MALVPIRVDRTSKPPVGTPLRSDGHWSVQRLVEAATNHGVDAVDLIQRRPMTRVGSVAVVPDGSVYNGSTYHYKTTQQEITLSECTILCLVRPTAVDTGPTTACCGFGNSASSNPLLMVGKGTSTGMSFRVRDISNVNQEVQGSSGVGWSNKTYTMITGLRSVSRNEISVYSNATVIASSAPTSMSATTFDRFCEGGLFRSTFGLGFAGSVSISLAYNIALFEEQIRALSANPWQIYEPETIWIEVGGGGGFTGIYSSSQAAQSQAALGALTFDGYSAQDQRLQSETVSSFLNFIGGMAQEQAINSEALLAALSFYGPIVGSQGKQSQALSSLLTFSGLSFQSQTVQHEDAEASLGFNADLSQTQLQQAQAIFQALVNITGAISQAQAAQIASLTAAMMFGGTSAQTQVAQIEALASVLSFSGSTAEGQESQVEALTSMLSFGGDISQQQAIQIEALAAILAAQDITGTAEQVQARQLQAASDFVVKIHAILEVSARDPLALIISVRDPLALRISGRDPLAINVTVH